MPWAVALVCLIAGCADVAPPDDVVPAVTPPVLDPGPEPVDLAVAYAGCDIGGIALTVDMATTDPWLPPGFTPRDAGELIDDVPTLGKAAVALLWQQCDDASSTPSGLSAGSLAVFVNGPVVEGRPVEAYRDFYEITHFTHEPAHDDVLEAIGWNVTALDDARLELVMEDTPSGPAGYGARPAYGKVLVDAGDAAVDADGVAGTTYFLKNRTTRFWHDAPDGLAYYDVVPDANGVGGGAACTIGPASALHRVTGSDRCAPDGAFSFFAGRLDMEGRIRFMPGVRAT